jgi:hypothetical protein
MSNMCTGTPNVQGIRIVESKTKAPARVTSRKDHVSAPPCEKEHGSVCIVNAMVLSRRPGLHMR